MNTVIFYSEKFFKFDHDMTFIVADFNDKSEMNILEMGTPDLNQTTEEKLDQLSKKYPESKIIQCRI